MSKTSFVLSMSAAALVVAFAGPANAQETECAVINDCTGPNIFQHQTTEGPWGEVKFDHQECRFCVIGGEVEQPEDCHPIESSCFAQLPEPLAATYQDLVNAALRGDAYTVLAGAVLLPTLVRFDAPTATIVVTGCNDAIVAAVPILADSELVSLARGFAAYRKAILSN